METDTPVHASLNLKESCKQILKKILKKTYTYIPCYGLLANLIKVLCQQNDSAIEKSQFNGGKHTGWGKHVMAHGLDILGFGYPKLIHPISIRHG